MAKRMTVAQKAYKKAVTPPKSTYRTRKFGGRVYHYVTEGNSKSTLNTKAEKIRKMGRFARVIPVAKKHPRWAKYVLLATK